MLVFFSSKINNTPSESSIYKNIALNMEQSTYSEPQRSKKAI